MLKVGKVSHNVRIFLAADVFYYTSYDAINTFLALLITINISPDRIDLAAMVIGYYMLLRALVEIPMSRLLVNQTLQAKLRLLMITHISYGFIIALLGLASSQLQIFTIMTLLALLDAALYPVKWALFSKILDKNNEETEWSLEDTLSSSSTAVFVVLGGMLAQQYGVQTLFFLMGGMFIISGLLYRFMHFKRHLLLLS
jgi:predicted MFS family arabinose efflux permease